LVKLCRKKLHELTPHNIYQDRGAVVCRKCMRLRIKKYKKTKKGKISEQKYMSKYCKTDTFKKIQKRYFASERGYITRKNHNFVNYWIIKKNICEDCQMKMKTEIHHEEYHNPPKLIDTAEVCHDCHVLRHKKGEGILA